MNGFTVPQRVRALGYAPEKRFMWSVGAAVRDRYEEIYGTLPPKENRPKTNGGGSHCFAIYPPQFRDEADRLIHELANMPRQLDLIDDWLAHAR